MNFNSKQVFSGLNIFFILILSFTAHGNTQTRQTDSMVSVGNHSLHVVTMGHGENTVIIEAGYMGELADWQAFANSIATFSKVVIYSRAGYGKSNPSLTPNTLNDSVEDLRMLIKMSKLKGPFIIVGHSYGGLIVRKFAELHPTHVKGLVFVEPASESYFKALREIDPNRTEASRKRMFGRLSGNKLEEYKLMMANYYDTPLDIIEVISLPDVPVVVLTAAKKRNSKSLANTPEARKAWREEHNKLFRKFSQGSHTVTTNSSHFIQIDEPQLITDAIKTVIDQANHKS
jgi:pimeloyl-ACP methyl ester carboxylesterase